MISPEYAARVNLADAPGLKMNPCFIALASEKIDFGGLKVYRRAVARSQCVGHTPETEVARDIL